ncbi:DUF4283 domain-containing protein, partial [Cephalotus follicularis]
AIWMRLPGLTLPLHNPSLLKAIGDSLGRFLRADDATLKFKNPRSARICVEMDLSVPPPPAFVATFGELKFQQSIIYESRLLYCSHCRLQGHCAQTCRNCKRKHAPLQGHASPPSPDIPLDSESPFSSDFNTLNFYVPSSVSPCPSASSSSRVPSKPRDLASTIELSGGTILTLPKYASSPIRVSNPDGSPSSLPTYESPL